MEKGQGEQGGQGEQEGCKGVLHSIENRYKQKGKLPFPDAIWLSHFSNLCTHFSNLRTH